MSGMAHLRNRYKAIGIACHNIRREKIENRKVWLAVDEDCAALTDDSAPARIVSPDDLKPAR